jgi:hypothetical protein
MKKFLTILTAFIAILVSSITANAQWTEKQKPADELKGTSACVVYAYQSTDGLCVYWSDEDEFHIVATSGIFDYDNHFVRVIVGFYDGDTLVEKRTESFYVPKGDSNTACVFGQLGRKIINHLENNGKVRFIAPRYGRSDFDLTVTPRL